MLNEVKHLVVVTMNIHGVHIEILPYSQNDMALRCRAIKPFAAEIFPGWVLRIDQCELLATKPPFYLLFTGDCGQYILFQNIPTAQCCTRW
jgi:hypothetical protein